MCIKLLHTPIVYHIHHSESCLHQDGDPVGPGGEDRDRQKIDEIQCISTGVCTKHAATRHSVSNLSH